MSKQTRRIEKVRALIKKLGWENTAVLINVHIVNSKNLNDIKIINGNFGNCNTLTNCFVYLTGDMKNNKKLKVEEQLEV